MSDLISRQAAIEVVRTYDFNFPQYMERFVIELRDAMKKDLEEDIKQMPSAQQWIPCNKKLPERNGAYLVWMQWPFEEEPTVSIINYDADCEAFGEWHEYYHPITLGYLDSDFDEIKGVIAWMPLPPAFKEE